MSRSLILAAAYLAMLCMACNKKQSPPEGATSKKPTQPASTTEPSSAQRVANDRSQVAAAQAATTFADGAAPMNDLAKIRSAAEKGNPHAQRLLGVKYSSGEGVDQDYLAAAQWFQKAAEGGDRIAYVDLGVLYRQGLGFAKDPVTAYMWFSLAADAGDNYSKTALAPLTSVMTQQQLSDAQAKAAHWKRTHANWNADL